MFKEFKEFAIKGNLLEIAVAFILALFFAAVVTALVDGVLLQLIAAIVGEPNFEGLKFKISGTPIRYGTVITAAVQFLLVALVLFGIVKSANRLTRPDAPTPVRSCPFCTTAIAEAATRCPACTSELQGNAPAV